MFMQIYTFRYLYHMQIYTFYVHVIIRMQIYTNVYSVSFTYMVSYHLHSSLMFFFFFLVHKLKLFLLGRFA